MLPNPSLPLSTIALTASLLLAGCAWGDVTGPTSGIEPARVGVGNEFACSAGSDLNVRCWGANDFGQLGIGSPGSRNTPTIVSGNLLFRSVGIHGTGRHACAVTTDGAAYCWGENHFGQIGDGTLAHRSTPVPILGGHVFSMVSAGWRFSCGITSELEAYCWGRGEWGQLGDGRATQSLEPVAVAGNHRFVTIEVGSNNLVCAIEVGGALYCWGLDRAGNIGAPSPETCTRSDGLQLPCATVPIHMVPELEFRDVAVGLSYACAVSLKNDLYCWGRNTSGQIGVEATDVCAPAGVNPVPCNPAPTPILSGIASASAGAEHTCAVSVDGRGFCWGRNRFGEIGDGGIGIDDASPKAVAGDLVFESISAGVNHSCGSTVTGELYCWGVNDRGQIGDGTDFLALTPSRVVDAFGGS